jgi:hypothetical protein
MFDDMIEKDERDEKVGPDHPIHKPDAQKPKTGPITGQKHPKAGYIKGIPHNYPCGVTDCKYYSSWTVDHPANTIPVPVAGSGGGTITIDKGWNPFWCMCCNNFKGIAVGRRK